MITNLYAGGVAPDFQQKLQLFSQFIGDWNIHSTWFLPHNVIVEGAGQVSFGWILYGTAIQDVWTGEAINPPEKFPKKGFGTTIRIYDDNIKAWKCIWIAPYSSVVMTFIARQKGDEIVLEGTNAKGNLENWIYSNITANSFEWRAEISVDKGLTWNLDQKIFAKKILNE